ncbi:MAG: hypothetical protein IT178_12595 [Acidobacteria bacterium]|nr:hypothetical protein [Acidobacteriota bacterium]
MSAAHSHSLPHAPERLALPASLRAASGLMVIAGVLGLGWAFLQGDAALAWSTYLIGAFFALGLGVFGLAWIAMLHLTGGAWSVTMRRVPEAMTAWIVPGGVLAMFVTLGAHTLYHWSDATTVAGDELLSHKAPFLNLTMFVVLGVISVVLWAAFTAIIVGASRRQDREGGIAATRSSRAMSALFMVFFAITFSIVSFYFLMSLDAHWFSTMFAVLVFTDVMQTGTAFVALMVALLVSAGMLEGFVTEHHLHSLGKMLFAWTGFWAYIYFCQFMLIWYANIPEETAYFLKRAENGWLPYLLVLPLLKFVVPFMAMLPRDAKRLPGRLIPVALLVLFAQFWELFLMVAPAVGHGETMAHGHLPIVELAGTLGFLGLFTLVFGWALARHDAVPLKDPALAECLAYHS